MQATIYTYDIAILQGMLLPYVEQGRFGVVLIYTICSTRLPSDQSYFILAVTR
jgi:hypothetical protein